MSSGLEAHLGMILRILNSELSTTIALKVCLLLSPLYRGRARGSWIPGPTGDLGAQCPEELEGWGAVTPSLGRAVSILPVLSAPRLTERFSISWKHHTLGVKPRAQPPWKGRLFPREKTICQKS